MERKSTFSNGGAKCIQTIATPTQSITFFIKAVILSLLSLLAITITSRAKDIDIWKNGVVVMNNDEVLICKVKFYEADDILLIRKDNEKTGVVYTAAKIKSFQIIDSAKGIIRKFITFAAPHQEKKLFYEALVEGKMHVMKREAAFGPNVFINLDNQTSTIKEFRRKILPKLKKENKEVIENFMAEHRLNLNFCEDVMKLAYYLNNLHSNELVVKE